MIIYECPTCKYKADRQSAMGDKPATPKPGDFTLCINCAEILTFEGEINDLQLVVATENDRADLMRRNLQAWFNLQLARKLLKEVIQARIKQN